MRQVLFSCLLAVVLGVGTAWAHHTTPGRSHPSVTLPQSVLADGKPLPAGTYEIWATDERPDVNAGAPSDAQRVVELAQNGKVVARVIAEVFPRADAREAVGTSGTTASSRARAELLRGGEFLRVSFTEPDGRYLIHLPTGPLNEPPPQPQSPSRIELVSPPANSPAGAPSTPATEAPSTGRP